MLLRIAGGVASGTTFVVVVDAGAIPWSRA
jgi:hypothetical protein